MIGTKQFPGATRDQRVMASRTQVQPFGLGRKFATGFMSGRARGRIGSRVGSAFNDCGGTRPNVTLHGKRMATRRWLVGGRARGRVFGCARRPGKSDAAFAGGRRRGAGWTGGYPWHGNCFDRVKGRVPMWGLDAGRQRRERLRVRQVWRPACPRKMHTGGNS